MRYLVDPRLILDVLNSESERSKFAMAVFEGHRSDELFIAPTSYLSLGPSFMGIRSMQDRFLENLGVRLTKDAPEKVMSAAYSAWSQYQKENPQETGGTAVFDLLYVGAYALMFDGILTLEGGLYRRYYETLNIVEK